MAKYRAKGFSSKEKYKQRKPHQNTKPDDYIPRKKLPSIDNVEATTKNKAQKPYVKKGRIKQGKVDIGSAGKIRAGSAHATVTKSSTQKPKQERKTSNPRKTRSDKGIKRDARNARTDKAIKLTPQELPPPLDEERVAEADFFTRAVISQFKVGVQDINQYARDFILSWLDDVIAGFGENATAQMLNNSAKAGISIGWDVLYDENKLRARLSEMLSFISDTSGSDANAYELYDLMEAEEPFNTEGTPYET